MSEGGDEVDEGEGSEVERRSGPEETEVEPEGNLAPPVRQVSLREGLAVALATTAATAGVIAFAFNPTRAGHIAIPASMGSLYVVLTAVAIVRLRRRGDLRRVFRPLGGDMTLGAITAGALYGLAHVTYAFLAKHGTPQEAWIIRLYLQLGEPSQLMAATVFGVAALEEVVWRGLVMRSLEDAFGGKRALVLSSILFAVAHAPTLFLLRDPVAGLNPFIVMAGLGCSVVWGAIVLRTERLVPAIFAHALFSWAIVEFPLWRP